MDRIVLGDMGSPTTGADARSLPAVNGTAGPAKSARSLLRSHLNAAQGSAACAGTAMLASADAMSKAATES